MPVAKAGGLPVQSMRTHQLCCPPNPEPISPLLRRPLTWVTQQVMATITRTLL